MKKLIYILTIVMSFTFCKGPGSGPLVKESFKKNDQNQAMEGNKHKARVVTEKVDVKVEPCSECITIAKLLADKQAFAGKTIKVKGQVTKYNSGIMGKNWVHIQDGSEFNGSFDLTITTDITTSVGETITVEGKIVLDKDFGYGYFYEVLMENGKTI